MISELSKINPNIEAESGHTMCHPETCTCWNIRLYATKDFTSINGNHYRKGENLFNTDSYASAEKFCKELVAFSYK